MSKHKISSAVVKTLIKNLPIKENGKSIEIWHRLDAQFGNDTPPKSQLWKRLKLFKNASEKGEQGDPIWMAYKNKLKKVLDPSSNPELDTLSLI